MIQCPHCETGMLWGVYLDIPPEMAEGKAEWMACEPPESDLEVTCPRCTQPAGTYEELFRKDAIHRRQSREERTDQLLTQVFVGELQDLLLIGISGKGNFERQSFLAGIWEQCATFQKALKKDKLLPRLRSTAQSEDQGEGENVNGVYIPQAIGLRFDFEYAASSRDREYLAAFPIAQGLILEGDRLAKLNERLADPDFNDPKGGKIESLHQGFYAKFFFKGTLKDYQQLPRLLSREWLDKNPYTLKAEEPWVEIFDELPAPFAQEHEDIEVTLCMPVEPKEMGNQKAVFDGDEDLS